MIKRIAIAVVSAFWAATAAQAQALKHDLDSADRKGALPIEMGRD